MSEITNSENQESNSKTTEESVSEILAEETSSNKGKDNNQKSLKNNNKIIIIIVGLLALCLSCFIGYSMKIKHEVLEAKLAAEQEYQKLQEDLSKIQTELNANEKELNDYKLYLKNKAENDKKLKDLLATIETSKLEISDLEKQTNNKTSELERLNGDILQAKGNPVSLPAGYLVVGKDLPAGRYKVTGSSNFQVYSSDGRIKINTILGGRIGVAEYVCVLSAGDIMECSGSDTFTPIE